MCYSERELNVENMHEKSVNERVFFYFVTEITHKNTNQYLILFDEMSSRKKKQILVDKCYISLMFELLGL